MDKLGDYLKACRSKKKLSLAKVQKMTGITNSRLCRAENGSSGGINPAELKKLADLYDVSVIPMFIMAGYLDKFDLEAYQLGFKNIDLLDSDEKKHIQDQIDFLIKKKG